MAEATADFLLGRNKKRKIHMETFRESYNISFLCIIYLECLLKSVDKQA